MSTDWERDTGLPWSPSPITGVRYAEHHYNEDGSRIVGQFGPWRLRDRLARRFGYHCWECMRL